MLIRLTPANDSPLHEQIAGAVRQGILDGSLPDGERLPAAKVLGQSLGVSLHTVLHAYQDLRDQGLIELRRGRGAVVIAPAPAAREHVLRILDDAASQLAGLGLSTESILALFRQRLDKETSS
ncbi:GntR family transcriptional regulator [Arthrobacter sp. zg-Y1219]|uniref:GntR family transcriptional regulator n=1 Tax=Arthrobacter sp. zg-Y1219 TaxID=3049067 RepID=UPI0024C28DF8|nr:GntR family transcriptional regulator [Arthrobacter sp. zg-Y1219]MDK1360726.1 GntR family transcriptional regulator [Arthrobacter sp. zg-Y1219]